MQTVYFISGLGADERAFSRLDLPDISACFIQWKTPLKNENLADYALRMAEEINDPEPVIAGLSFGGMVAIEIAKQRPVKKVILISSIKTRKEMPILFKWAASVKLHKLMPMRLLAKPNLIVHYFFGVRKHKNVKELLNSILLSSDTSTTEWAINQIMTWQNETELPNLVHLHGTSDKVFPIKNVSPDYIIKGGSHFMVWTKAREVSDILRKEIHPQPAV